MKYYYKTPEEVQKEIQEHIAQYKTSPYNKLTLLTFMSIVIILISLLVLDQSGILQQSSSIPKSIGYTLQDRYFILHFRLKKNYILVDSTYLKNTRNTSMLKLQEIGIETRRKQHIIKPVFPKTLLEQPYSKVSIDLGFLISEKIKNTYIIINGKKIFLKPDSFPLK